MSHISEINSSHMVKNSKKAISYCLAMPPQRNPIHYMLRCRIVLTSVGLLPLAQTGQLITDINIHFIFLLENIM